MFPDVARDKSESKYARQRPESCIQAAWDTLDKGLFDNLGQSMHDRCEAVIAAKGWYINIKIIRRINPHQIKSIERANRNNLNNVIFMRIGLMVIE
jgi:hypothetical protein